MAGATNAVLNSVKRGKSEKSSNGFMINNQNRVNTGNSNKTGMRRDRATRMYRAVIAATGRIRRLLVDDMAA
jgi:hypothetical protein